LFCIVFKTAKTSTSRQIYHKITQKPQKLLLQEGLSR
jgi:hypothetical protein